MVMYGDSDLQRYKLDSQLSLLPFDIADLLDFLQSLENARKFPLSEIWTLAKIMLAYQRYKRPLSQSALKRVKAWPNHERGQPHFPHASACLQEIGRWYWHGWSQQFVCEEQLAAQA